MHIPIFCAPVAGDDPVLLNVVGPGQLTAAAAPLHRLDEAVSAAGADLSLIHI